MCQETQWRKRTTSRLWHTTLFPRLNSCIVASSSCHSRKHGLISLKSFAKHVCHYDVPCKTIKHEQRKKTWNQQKQYQWERNQIYIYIYIYLHKYVYIYIYTKSCVIWLANHLHTIHVWLLCHQSIIFSPQEQALGCWVAAALWHSPNAAAMPVDLAPCILW